MKIAYVTTYDGRDVEKSWGGTGYYIAETLKRQCSGFEYIGRLKRSLYSRLFTRSKKEIYSRLLRKTYMSDREPSLLKCYAKQVAQRLSSLDYDVVFSPGTIPIAHLQTQKPIVFWTDAVFASIVDHYPEFSNLCHETVANGNAMEKAALEKCTLGIYSSEWAANSAVQYYDVDKRKIRVVPFGANFDFTPSLEQIKAMINSRPRKVCNLLFLGVDWYRKGGDIAFQVAQRLNQYGLNTQLAIVGCNPPGRIEASNFIRVYGFLKKSNREEMNKFYQIMSESHFLILSPKADCAPNALREVNAFGMPCVATKVGGIPTIIRDDLNGKMLSVDASIDEYCDYILSLMSDYDRYKELALSSFNEYKERLNWGVAGESVKKLLASLIR